jgi:isoquinoline 1-oxidoreductase
MIHDRTAHEQERYEFSEPPRYHFSLTRRAFVQSVGAGLLISAYAPDVLAQRRANGAGSLAARFHFEADGTVIAFTGKVEVGQGARTQISQAAAEELGLPLDQVHLVMADTDLVPDDGGTYGSQTTPRTVPAMRAAAAAARELLIELAAGDWAASAGAITFSDGVFTHIDGRRMTLAALVAQHADIQTALDRKSPGDSAQVPQSEWRVLGHAFHRPNARDVATGAHRYPSDVRRAGMVFGKVLRAPAYRAQLESVDIDVVKGMDGVQAVRDGDFVGCVAQTSRGAQAALERIAVTAKWKTQPHPSSAELANYLKANVREGAGRGQSQAREQGNAEAALASAGRVIRAMYTVPYIQHAPMETRAAAAEWSEGRLTVWTATQRPFDVRRELAEAFSMAPEKVRLVVPDSGGGFGGKHQGDAAVEAARLAKAAGRPVSLQWTREEEFMWAYFRPAGVIEIAGAIDADGNPFAWDFTNYNSGGSGLECPYAFPNVRVQFKNCESPLRQGSYRALAATANNFARESFIDRLAQEARKDPLAFRLSTLKEERMKGVLQAAADKFGVRDFSAAPAPGVGHGIACGTEKGSFVAICAEVHADRAAKSIKVRRLCVAFDCGPVLNPAGLRAQIEGGVIMGLGGALREAIEFRDGKLTNGRFKDYLVPRFEDVPPIEVVFVEGAGAAPAGAGETPIIALAPAIANAVRQATGAELTSLPLERAFA